MKPEELLRKNEVAYKSIDLQNNNYTEDEILNLMIENPDLVQRPIVEKRNKAILATPSRKDKRIV